ncbi:MAG: hypothetical protein JRN68_09305, partial [Nitrososphaerota archaeon]|nr:hypothetical protein [Nitrososphaerota archaeon]
IGLFSLLVMGIRWEGDYHRMHVSYYGRSPLSTALLMQSRLFRMITSSSFGLAVFSASALLRLV